MAENAAEELAERATAADGRASSRRVVASSDNRIKCRKHMGEAKPKRSRFEHGGKGGNELIQKRTDNQRPTGNSNMN